MMRLSHLSLTIRGRRLFGRVAFAFLLLCSIALGALGGLFFVYASDLPEVRALEDYRPNVVTELYGDDGQLIGTFALQRRILISYEEIPSVLKDAILVTEDQHFEEHWGVDFPRVAQAAYRNMLQMRKAEGASTLTMQLAGTLFLDRTDRSFRRKIQETMLATQIERRYTKPQILTMYCNQVYLAHGMYGVEAASQFYFSKPTRQLMLTEAALLAGMFRGPAYSPILHPQRAAARRNLVLDRMVQEGKISTREAEEAKRQPLELRIQYPRNNLAPYFFEEIRKYLEQAYGTEAVHERGLRVYTTLNVAMQLAANKAVRNGLHAYDRRHGWRGKLTNVVRDNLGRLDSYEDADWRQEIGPGNYVTGLVSAVDDRSATVKLGPYRALVTAADIAWTGRKFPRQLLRVGDLAMFQIKSLTGTVARVELEQRPDAQAAFVAIENASGEIKAMVGGYSFEESKFNRATQALRQVGSSFKPYLYATAIEKGYSPFDTIVDAPLTTVSGGQSYSPQNYDEKYEGTITLRRALAGSRNIPAVKLAEKVGISNVVEMGRRFGVTSSLPPYLPLVLGAAEITLVEHTSSFTVFPNDGIRLDPHLIRRVTTYEGAVLEEARPKVREAIAPDVARTLVAMLEEVVQYGTGTAARELGRPVGGKTGTTNDYTDAWFLGFTPALTTGVWVGFDDNQHSLGKGETGAKAALPIWLDFMKVATAGIPVEDFPNVVPLSKIALTKNVKVDTPDTAPAEEVPESSLPAKTPSTINLKPAGQ